MIVQYVTCKEKKKSALQSVQNKSKYLEAPKRIQKLSNCKQLIYICFKYRNSLTPDESNSVIVSTFFCFNG